MWTSAFVVNITECRTDEKVYVAGHFLKNCERLMAASE